MIVVVVAVRVVSVGGVVDMVVFVVSWSGSRSLQCVVVVLACTCVVVVDGRTVRVLVRRSFVTLCTIIGCVNIVVFSCW